MVPAGKIHDKEEANWNFFLSLPDVDRTKVRTDNIRSMQVLRPLFEFSGACAGCGETPYVKMLSQLFGNRLDRKSTRLNSSHSAKSRMPSSA